VWDRKLLLGNWRAAPACGLLSLPPDKHPYLFSRGRVAAEATGPRRSREMTSHRWRLSPGQGSRVAAGGGGGAAERRGDRQSAGGQSGHRRAGRRAPIEYLAPDL